MSNMEAATNIEPEFSGLLPWLRWAGGKRALAPQLVSEIMATSPKLYIEPFLGGGAVALALPAALPKILADVNPHLIDCWLCIQKIPGVLFAELDSIEHEYGNHQTGYLAVRAHFNEAIKNPRLMWARRSAMFLYLNARCFNGLWRTNASGKFNVPFGKLDKPKRIESDELMAWSIALKSVTLKAGHFTNVLGDEFTRRANAVRGVLQKLLVMLRGVVVYADPPYDGTFDGYAKGGFDEAAQRVLAAQLASMATAGAGVWANNADTPLVREIYSWAQIESTDEQHSVGSKAERRGKRGCVLIRGGAALR